MCGFIFIHVLINYCYSALKLINVAAFEKRQVFTIFNGFLWSWRKENVHLHNQNIFLSVIFRLEVCGKQLFFVVGTINIPGNIVSFFIWTATLPSGIVFLPHITLPTCDISYTWESVTINPTEAVVHTHTVRCCIVLHNILLRKLIVSNKLSMKANWRNTTSFLVLKYITQERLHRKLLRRVMQE